MTEKLQRIYIVGGQGSGKTTFAKLLSQKLGMPNMGLDTIRQPGNTKTVRKIPERTPFVKEIAQKPEWIIEGIYISWIKDILDRADQIIFLDLPPRITIPRVIIRYFKRKKSGNDKYGFRNEMSLVQDILNYQNPKPGNENSIEDRYISRQKTIDTLKQYMDKVITLHSTKEINGYLKNI